MQDELLSHLAENCCVTDEPDMIECEVTGKTIPRDDAVVFQGKWVGAEGKAILLDRLRSGADEPGALVAGSIGKRIIAYVVDGIICTIPVLIIGLPLGLTIFTQSAGNEPGAPPPQYTLGQAVFELIVMLAFITYLTVLHARSGQTLGKMVAKIKVVRLDGSPITYSQSFLRAIYFVGFNLLTEIAVVAMVAVELAFPESAPGLQGSFQTILISFTSLASVYMLADILALLFDRAQRRAIHDRLAGTRVVRVS